jgi:hypothetical protein
MDGPQDASASARCQSTVEGKIGETWPPSPGSFHWRSRHLHLAYGLVPVGPAHPRHREALEPALIDQLKAKLSEYVQVPE